MWTRGGGVRGDSYLFSSLRMMEAGREGAPGGEDEGRRAASNF